MQIQPYLFFEGRCDEAIAFYQAALGAEVTMLMRFAEAPDQAMTAADNGAKVMHAVLKIGETRILMSDGRCGGKTAFGGFSLSLSVADEAEADRVFEALRDGGSVFMPLETTFFAKRFGMLTDRFGVGWMVMNSV
jgi:PhnB protein